MTSWTLILKGVIRRAIACLQPFGARTPPVAEHPFAKCPIWREANERYVAADRRHAKRKPFQDAMQNRIHAALERGRVAR